MKLIDCFPFQNELALLKYRLEKHDPYIHKFVIVECTHTFAGKPKTLHLETNRDAFAPYLDKIVHIVVTNPPNNGDPWINDWFQRSHIAAGIAHIENELAPEDLILLSDCDEIQSPEFLARLPSIHISRPQNISMKPYYYRPYFYNPEPWTRPKVFSQDWWTKMTPKSIQLIRDDMNITETIENGGWHLSYFGDQIFITNKIQNASHQELNIPTIASPDVIQSKLTHRTDFKDPLLDHTLLKYIPLDSGKSEFSPEDYQRLLEISTTPPPAD